MSILHLILWIVSSFHRQYLKDFRTLKVISHIYPLPTYSTWARRDKTFLRFDTPEAHFSTFIFFLEARKLRRLSFPQCFYSPHPWMALYRIMLLPGMCVTTYTCDRNTFSAESIPRFPTPPTSYIKRPMHFPLCHLAIALFHRRLWILTFFIFLPLNNNPAR